MGSGTSGLYSGTHGANQAASASKGSKAAMRQAARGYASEEAERLTAISNSKRKAFNTACVAYDSKTGKTYYGRNGGIELSGTAKNPTLFGEGGLLPDRSLNHLIRGNCAEVDAINNALNDRAELKNLYIYTIHTDKRRFGTSKDACENCTAAFKGKVKRNYTGWYKDKEN